MTDTIYKQLRTELKLSRDDVCDYISDNELGGLTPERLERIENGKFSIHPEEVKLLSKVYKNPAVCNHYCSNECEIGKDYVPEVKIHDLEKIILSMVASLNSVKRSQERLIEITADGFIADDELKDFVFIKKELERISMTVEALQLWTEQMVATGKINMEKYKILKESD